MNVPLNLPIPTPQVGKWKNLPRDHALTSKGISHGRTLLG